MLLVLDKHLAIFTPYVDHLIITSLHFVDVLVETRLWMSARVSKKCTAKSKEEVN